ncbi:hypothetical protein HYX19_02270 [Candidatus Woesearchaeota archaeon]|nr:hypothetical protein [Candidatus Woesearchaeota archaeon]
MEWTDEEGKLIEILPFFVKVYTNDEGRKLSQEYDIKSYSGRAFLKRCTEVSELILLEDLLNLSQFTGTIVGVSIKELIKFKNYKEGYPELVKNGYLKVVENELIFPTEKLILELDYLGAIRKSR